MSDNKRIEDSRSTSIGSLCLEDFISREVMVHMCLILKSDALARDNLKSSLVVPGCH